MKPAKPDRWWLIPAIFSAIAVAPTALTRFPPMADLSAHLQSVSMLVNREKPEFLPNLYQLNWGHPNQLFHFIAMCLGYLIGPEPAVKVVVCLTLFAIMMGVTRLIHLRHGDPMLGLVSATITTGFLYAWGLVTNLLGLAILIWIFPWLDEYGRKPNLRDGIKFAIGGVLVYFGHEVTFILLAGASALWAILFWSTPRRFLLQVIWLPMAYAMHVWELYFHESKPTNLKTIWAPFGFRLQHMVDTIWAGSSTLMDWGLLLFTLLLVLPLIRWRRVRSLRRWLLVRRHLVFAASCFVLYFVMPTFVHGATLIHQRFFPIGWLFLLVGAAPRASEVRGWQRLTWVLVPFVTVVTVIPGHLAAYELMTDLEQVIPLMERGASVVSVDADHNDENHPGAFFDADNYVASLHGGRSAATFAESPIAPMWIPEEKRWAQALLRVFHFGGGFKPASDFQYFRYVILRTQDQRKALAVIKAMKPEGKFVAHIGVWTILESTLTVLSPETPMPPMFKGFGLTLFQRVNCVGSEGHSKEWLQSDRTWQDMPGCQAPPGVMLEDLPRAGQPAEDFDLGPGPDGGP